MHLRGFYRSRLRVSGAVDCSNANRFRQKKLIAGAPVATNRPKMQA
jgi:hypothetical protein